MKTKNQLYLSCFLLLLMSLLFNAGLFYSVNYSGNYLQTKSVWKEYHSVKFSDYRRQKQLLASLPTDPEQALTVIGAVQNYLRLTPKKQEKELKTSPYAEYLQSMNITAEDYANFSEVADCISNSLYYGNFISGIRTNADNIASVLYPLNQNDWAVKNAAKCELDYYGMEHLTLPILIDSGIQLMVQYRITDILCFLMLTAFAFLFSLYLKNRMELAVTTGRSDYLLIFLLSFLGVILMYLSNLYLTAKYAGLPSLQIPLQSIRAFYVCPYPVTLVTFLLLWVSLKTASLVLLLLFCLIAYFGKHRIQKLSFTFSVIAAELYFASYSGEDALPVVLREINLFSGFTCERFFNRYLNLNLGGRVISRISLYFLIFLPVLFVTLTFSIKKFRSMQKRTAAALQQSYFEEIDKRYQETRRLWHDFNNHLLAIKALYSSGNTAEAEKYIEELSLHGRENLLPVKTGSKAVDLLLFKKHQQAKEQKTTLSFTIGCRLNGCGIADYDLCSLLGNLLDNALEACRLQEGSVILLRMEEQNSLLFLSCQNPYQGSRQEENGLYPSTKPDRTQHGIGLQSVKQICKKYHGSLEIQCSDQIFTVNLLLNKTK